VARFNLNRVQATALAARLLNALEVDQDAPEVPPAIQLMARRNRRASSQQRLGIDPAITAKGLGVQGGAGSRRGQGRGGQTPPGT
jgi:hypothetical protein